MSASICFKPSGSMAPPVLPRTLKPLSCGGLWLAVMLMAPSARRSGTAKAMTGVGVAPAVNHTLIP